MFDSDTGEAEQVTATPSSLKIAHNGTGQKSSEIKLYFNQDDPSSVQHMKELMADLGRFVAQQA